MNSLLLLLSFVVIVAIVVASFYYLEHKRDKSDRDSEDFEGPPLDSENSQNSSNHEKHVRFADEVGQDLVSSVSSSRSSSPSDISDISTRSALYNKYNGYNKDFNFGNVANMSDTSSYINSDKSLDIESIKRATMDAYKNPSFQREDRQNQKKQQEFNMPVFDIGGGVLSREKTPQQINAAQPHFNNFTGIQRGMGSGVSDMEANELNDDNVAAFSRGSGLHLEKIQPRMTLAMRMMNPDELKTLIDASNPKPTGKQAERVLDGIDIINKSKNRTGKSDSKHRHHHHRK